MKISYNWLKNYINVDLDVDKVSQLLTDCGLEVEGTELFQAVRGGLEGLVTGEVLTKEKHPDADKLSLTTVSIGQEAPLKIVCGAPNVDVGQKVVVAPIGATIYPVEGAPMTMKRAKIRGQESEGMICAEDEIGLGKGHEGILVLDPSAPVGMLAKDYFNIETDTVLEIGLTPNRADAFSHYGVARDLRAVIVNQGLGEQEMKKIELIGYGQDNDDLNITVEVADPEACSRYAGVTITGVTVKPSPEWLQNRLLSIGLKPINNIVDITNYVLHDLGQPLHAFDANKIKGKKVVVKTLPEKTKFTTLDGIERELSANDLMICDAEGGMCIAGIFGGINSGIQEDTTSVFLESAYFNPVFVRKTAKRHGLNTDASFRFERGVDPNMTVVALKRAALMIKELAGGKISSGITDVYPNPVQNFEVEITYKNCKKLIGKDLGTARIKSILTSLEIEIISETGEGLKLSVPPFKVDVQREADIIEELLRIYGYNNIELPEKLTSSLSFIPDPDKEKVQHLVSGLLVNNGFNEIMSNSLTKKSYFDNSRTIAILNPLSSELNAMRQNLLYGGLECLAHNINHKRNNLKLFEFGNIYFKEDNKYNEQRELAIFLTGNEVSKNWNTAFVKVNLFSLKSIVDGIIKRLGIDRPGIVTSETQTSCFSYGITYTINNKTIADFGLLKDEILNNQDIEQEIFYAAFNWDNVVSLLKMNKISYKEVSKFPEVRRDLSMLLDDAVKFESLKEIASRTERKLLKNVGLFDVYQGKNLEPGKKSYALSFVLQDEHKTLSDKEIDKVMNKIQRAFEQELGARLR